MTKVLMKIYDLCLWAGTLEGRRGRAVGTMLRQLYLLCGSMWLISSTAVKGLFHGSSWSFDSSLSFSLQSLQTATSTCS